MAYISQSANQALRNLNSAEASALEGNWVGKEKTRYDFVLKYLSGHSTSRGYYVHSFQDRNYNRFLAFLDCETISIGPDCEPLAIGDCFSCKATVNRHGVNTYKSSVQNSFKETVLNRIKFKDLLGPSDG